MTKKRASHTTEKQPAKSKPDAAGYAEQIHELQSLHVRSASWMADVSVSTLRDAVNRLPPNKDGCFDAKEVIDWVIGRRAPKLSDSEHEGIMRAAEAMTDGFSGREHSAVIRLLGDMRQKHGKDGDTAFVDALMERLGWCEDHEPEPLPDVSDEALLCRARLHYERYRHEVARDRLETAVGCEGCGKRCSTRALRPPSPKTIWTPWARRTMR